VYYYRKAFSATLAGGAFFVSEAMEKKVKKRASGGRAGCRGGGWLKSVDGVKVAFYGGGVRSEIMSTGGGDGGDGWGSSVRRFGTAGEVVDYRQAIAEVVLVLEGFGGACVAAEAGGDHRGSASAGGDGLVDVDAGGEGAVVGDLRRRLRRDMRRGRRRKRRGPIYKCHS